MAPAAIFLGSLAIAQFTEDRPFFGFVAMIGLALAAIALIVVTLYQRWLFRLIAPDAELRRNVFSLSLFRPFGTRWAVRELLDQAVLRGGNKPL